MRLDELLLVLKEYEFMAGPGMIDRPDTSGVRMHGAQTNFIPSDDNGPEWPYDDDQNIVHGQPTGPKGFDRGSRPGTDVHGGPPTARFQKTWDGGPDGDATGDKFPGKGEVLGDELDDVEPVKKEAMGVPFNAEKAGKAGNQWGAHTLPGTGGSPGHAVSTFQRPGEDDVPRPPKLEAMFGDDPAMTYGSFDEWWREAQEYAKVKGHAFNDSAMESAKEAFDNATSPYDFVDLSTQDAKGYTDFELEGFGQAMSGVDGYGARARDAKPVVQNDCFDPGPVTAEAPEQDEPSKPKDGTDDDLENRVNRIYGQDDNPEFSGDDSEGEEGFGEPIRIPISLSKIGSSQEDGGFDFRLGGGQGGEMPNIAGDVPNVGHGTEFLMSPDKMGSARGSYGLKADSQDKDLVDKRSAWDVLQAVIDGMNANG